MLSASPWIISLVVVVVLLFSIRQLRGSYGGSRSFAGLVDYSDPEKIFGWFGLFLVLSGALSVGWLDHLPMKGWYPFWLALVVGFVGSIFSLRVLRGIREIILSIVAVPIAILEVKTFIESEAEIAQVPGLIIGVMFTMTLIMFGFGAFLNFLRIFALPKLGQSALGAIDIIIFLMTPFGLSMLADFPVELQIVVMVIAAVAGFGAAVAPQLIISLAVLAIVVAEVSMKVLMWLDSEGVARLDWTTALMMLGISLGFALPHALTRSRSI